MRRRTNPFPRQAREVDCTCPYFWTSGRPPAVEIRVTVFPVVFVRIFRARERAGKTRTLAIDTYLIFVCVVALRVDLL